MSKGFVWSKEAEARLKRAPAFLRPMVRSVTERKAQEAGVQCITAAFLDRVRQATMDAGSVARPATEPGCKPIVWTKAARAKLEEAPDFMRDILRRIVEEIAAERGHLEVNCKLLDQVEELGARCTEPRRMAIPWSREAEEMLAQRLEKTPELAAEFMRDLLRVDAEDLAREMGAVEVDAGVLRRTWEQPLAPVSWTAAARARLNDAPDFVRSGIKKAAERRARREGLRQITCEDLTRFRNEAMMKAVKRMRVFGFRELTFDGVFEAASSRVKRLRNNPQAAARFAEIREHVEHKEGGIGLLDHDMVQKMREYLRNEGK